jgi:hypothetical protein
MLHFVLMSFIIENLYLRDLVRIYHIVTLFILLYSLISLFDMCLALLYDVLALLEYFLNLSELLLFYHLKQ